MEIQPVPHRTSRGERRRLALGLLVLAPVILLVLLPAVLGLDRHVITDSSMQGSLGNGSVVLTREVPPGDLRVGDVISFQPPGGRDDEPVTHRIVALDHGVATTRGDATALSDPWQLRLDDATYARVMLSVPWVGYPFVVDGGWMLLVVAAVAASAIAVSTTRRQTRVRRERALRASRSARRPLRVG